MLVASQTSQLLNACPWGDHRAPKLQTTPESGHPHETVCDTAARRARLFKKGMSLLCLRCRAPHLEGESGGEGHEHDRGALRVLHSPRAAAAGAEGGPAGAPARALAALAALCAPSLAPREWCHSAGERHAQGCLSCAGSSSACFHASKQRRCAHQVMLEL